MCHAAVTAPQPIREQPATASASQAGTNSNGLQQDVHGGMQAPAAALLAAATAQAHQDEEFSLYDPSIRMKKRKPGLSLFQIGAVPKEFQQAIEARKAQVQAPDGARGASTSAAADDASMAMAVGDDDELEAPPHMEWWDAALLAQATYDVEEGAEVAVREGKITNLVEHPIPIEPPVQAPRAAPQPLMLTKKVCVCLCPIRVFLGLTTVGNKCVLNPVRRAGSLGREIWTVFLYATECPTVYCEASLEDLCTPQ